MYSSLQSNKLILYYVLTGDIIFYCKLSVKGCLVITCLLLAWAGQNRTMTLQARPELVAEIQSDPVGSAHPHTASAASVWQGHKGWCRTSNEPVQPTITVTLTGWNKTDDRYFRYLFWYYDLHHFGNIPNTDLAPHGSSSQKLWAASKSIA